MMQPLGKRPSPPPLCPLTPLGLEQGWDSEKEFDDLYHRGPPYVVDLGPGYYRPWVTADRNAEIQARVDAVPSEGRGQAVKDLQYLLDENQRLRAIVQDLANADPASTDREDGCCSLSWSHRSQHDAECAWLLAH